MSLLRIRITLEDVEPATWRLVEIGGFRTLAEVHDAIQIAIGWTDSHLHVFEHPDGRRWSVPSVENDLDERDEADVTLAEATSDGLLHYEYDFGDGWTHRLEVVGSIDGDDAQVVLRDGARSAPPEDCGGPPGYARLLAALADSASPEHDSVSAWLADQRLPWEPPRAFDAERLDVEAVNRRLARRFRPDQALSAWGDELRRVVARMPQGAQTAFGDHLERAELERPVVLDPDVAAASVQPFAWLLERVGDGLSLTSAGRLPPAVVREASQALGWDQRWMGAVNREDHVPPAAALREWATKTMLVRKYRGTLLLTRAGLSARRATTELMRHLATHALRVAPRGAGQEAAVLLLAELAAGAEPRREPLLDAVALGLHLIGYADEDGWGPPTASSVSGLTSRLRGLLGMLGLAEGDYFREPVPGWPSAVRGFARLALQAG